MVLRLLVVRKETEHCIFIIYWYFYLTCFVFIYAFFIGLPAILRKTQIFCLLTWVKHINQQHTTYQIFKSSDQVQHFNFRCCYLGVSLWSVTFTSWSFFCCCCWGVGCSNESLGGDFGDCPFQRREPDTGQQGEKWTNKTSLISIDYAPLMDLIFFFSLVEFL